MNTINVRGCSACKDNHYDVEIQKLKNPVWIHTDGIGSVEYTDFYICQETDIPIIVYVRIGITNSAIRGNDSSIVRK